MSGGPILNNGTQYPCWNETNEKREIYEDILGKKILSGKWERKVDFRNVVMDPHS